jgi:predicted nucleic acid-binding protein
MVAAVCSWHEHHAAAAAEIGRRLAHGDRLCCAAHALVEAYAVLTRLPPPHRLSAADAWTLIKANFVDGATVVTLAADRYADVLERASRLQIAGGRTYDVVIGECAREAKADVLLTFNRRHFDPPPAGVTVVEPAR